MSDEEKVIRDALYTIPRLASSAFQNVEHATRAAHSAHLALDGLLSDYAVARDALYAIAYVYRTCNCDEMPTPCARCRAIEVLGGDPATVSATHGSSSEPTPEKEQR